MKSTIIILLVIVVEACALTWLFSAENSQLSAENAKLKHQLAYQKDKIAELNWVIAKMDLLLAGKTAEEIFSKEENTAEIKEDDNEKEEDVIYLD